MRKYTWNDIDAIAFEINNLKAAVVETDTVMGLISKDPKLIYKIKRRSPSKKLIIFVNDINLIDDLTQKEKTVLKKYWPGALTIIKNKVGYRIPNHKNLLKLLDKIHFAYSSSANISGNQPVQTSDIAEKTFSSNYDNLIIVEGSVKYGEPSTIVDLDNMKIVRQGMLKVDTLLKELKGL